MIRLQRVGRKNEARFRLVLTDKRNSTKSGKFKEVLGSYNPKTSQFQADSERISHWMKNGAQVTQTVNNFLIDAKIISGKKMNVLPKKSKTVKRKEAKSAK